MLMVLACIETDCVPAKGVAGQDKVSDPAKSLSPLFQELAQECVSRSSIFDADLRSAAPAHPENVHHYEMKVLS